MKGRGGPVPIQEPTGATYGITQDSVPTHLLASSKTQNI